jgi:hypothetical protein
MSSDDPSQPVILSKAKDLHLYPLGYTLAVTGFYQVIAPCYSCHY